MPAPQSRPSSLILLTRPAGRNEALENSLQARGSRVICAPLLTVNLHPQARENWLEAAAFDLIIFVSSYAAQCWLQVFTSKSDAPCWPAHTLAATVGTASAQPLRDLVPAARLIHPSPEEPQDSESLWQRLQSCVKPSQSTPPRVLIVGAAQGRDWLQKQLQQHGCKVMRYAVYERQPAQWQEVDVRPVHQALTHAMRPIVLLTSTQAVQALNANLRHLNLTALYEQARFLLIHPRIAEPLQTLAQHANLDVTTCAPDDDAILNAIAQMQAATITP